MFFMQNVATDVPAYSRVHTCVVSQTQPRCIFKVANPCVYTDYKHGLLCYPCGNFDLLFSYHSTLCMRVTITDLRLYSTYRSCNQACLYYYALHGVSDTTEHTFYESREPTFCELPLPEPDVTVTRHPALQSDLTRANYYCYCSDSKVMFLICFSYSFAVVLHILSNGIGNCI